jgi:exodeoxyribonuclease VII large subunit
VLEARLRRSTLDGVARHRRHLDGCAKLLASLSYRQVLQRGFALVRDEAGRSVRSATQLDAGQRLDIELADGRVSADVTKSDEAARPARPQSVPSRSKPSGGRNGSQGSLF